MLVYCAGLRLTLLSMLSDNGLMWRSDLAKKLWCHRLPRSSNISLWPIRFEALHAFSGALAWTVSKLPTLIMETAPISSHWLTEQTLTLAIMEITKVNPKPVVLIHIIVRQLDLYLEVHVDYKRAISIKWISTICNITL